MQALQRWKSRENLPQDAHKKVREKKICINEVLSKSASLCEAVNSTGLIMMMQVKLMCSYCKKHDDTEVPDPYYGGPEGFEKVILSLKSPGKSIDESDIICRFLELVVAHYFVCLLDIEKIPDKESTLVELMSSSLCLLQVLDLLEDACESMLDSILAEISS